MKSHRKYNPKYIGFVVLAILFCCIAEYILEEAQNSAAPLEYKVCFTPGGKCLEKIIKAIDSATEEIKVHSYSFTSRPIAHSLMQAKSRGVDIIVLGDKGQSQNKYSVIKGMLKSGIPVFIYPTSGYAHNKIMIIDRKIVITGSYNWSHSAEYRNTENVLFLQNVSLAKEYLKNWRKQISVSQQM